jgi:hypothetical protein
MTGKSEGEAAEENADRVESKPSNPLDIFEAAPFQENDETPESKADREEEQLTYMEDAIDFGEFEDLEIVDEDDDSKSAEDKAKGKKKDEETEDEEGEKDSKEDKDDEEDEDEGEEEEEDEEESEEESELLVQYREQNESLTATLNNLQQKLAEVETAVKKKEESTEEEDDGKPVFNLAIPDELVASVASGEPAEMKKALAWLANGVAEATRRQLLKEGRETLDKRFADSDAARKAAETEAEQKGAIAEDFYGKYPGYKDNPRLVAMCAADYFAKHPGEAWGPGARDGIATLIKDIVKFDGKASKAKASRRRGRKSSEEKPDGNSKAKGKKKKSAGRRPPRQIKAGTRVAEAVTKRKDRQEDIAETFSDFRGR